MSDRILAVDIGEKRCGLAISDTKCCVATPVDIVTLSEATNASGAFAEVIDNFEPALLLFGLPKTLSGKEGRQAFRIKSIAGQIARAASIPYEFCDERLSTREAKRAMAEMGYDSKKMRGKVDAIAACLFLQMWLDLKGRV